MSYRSSYGLDQFRGSPNTKSFFFLFDEILVTIIYIFSLLFSIYIF